MTVCNALWVVLTTTGYDLRQHELGGLVLLSVCAAGQPLAVAIFLLLVFVFELEVGVVLLAFAARLEAVQADDKAALVADPVHVEERRVADVTHLTHALDSTLPRDFR